MYFGLMLANAALVKLLQEAQCFGRKDGTHFTLLCLCDISFSYFKVSQFVVRCIKEKIPK